MSKFMKIKLSEVVEVKGGYAFKSDNFSEHGYPVIRISNISNGVLDFSSVAKIPEEKIGKGVNYIVHPGDILIAMSGATTGKVGIVPDGIKKPVFQNQRVGNYQIKDSKKVLKEFLHFLLISPMYQRHIWQFAAGAAQPNISAEELVNIDVILPNVSEQAKIAKTLNAVNSLIQKRHQSLAKFDQLTQSMFLDMFVYSKASQKWPEVKIEDLAANVPVAMRSGPFGSDLKHSEFVDEGVAVLGIDNVATNEFKWGERRFITEKKYQELKRYTIRPRDVLITIMATLGRTCVVPDNIPLSINTKHLAALTIDPNKGSPYFISKAFLYHPDILGQLKISEKGAIMAGLNLGIIKGIKLKIPPIDLQNVYEKRILKIREMRFKLIQSLNQVEELQQSLSQKFFGQ